MASSESGGSPCLMTSASAGSSRTSVRAPSASRSSTLRPSNSEILVRSAAMGASLAGERHPLHHRRPRADLVVPALHRRKPRQLDAVPLVARHPGVDRHVGNRILRREVLILRQVLVHHPVEALRLVAVALAAVGDLVLFRAHEMVRLAEHRPDPAHLEHEPLQNLVSVFLWKKPTG